MKQLPIDPKLQPFVKHILLMECDDPNAFNDFPFYADGYPGLMYSETKSGVYLQPRNKRLSIFYLYGQTLEPISLSVKGQFRFIVYRLYPFAVRLLLGINPRDLNDDCYDLLHIDFLDMLQIIHEIVQAKNIESQVQLMDSFILNLIKHSAANPDYVVKLALNTIINSKGKITIKNLRAQLYIGERTFERRFAKEIGITPKQFAKIIQFSYSMNQISDKDYDRLTEISYESGFADQSHFIRTFKKYTGKTPKEFQRQIAS